MKLWSKIFFKKRGGELIKKRIWRQNKKGKRGRGGKKKKGRGGKN